MNSPRMSRQVDTLVVRLEKNVERILDGSERWGPLFVFF